MTMLSKYRHTVAACAIIAGSLTACASLPTNEAAAVPLSAALRTVVIADNYAVNPDNTEISFVAGPTPIGAVRGSFAEFDGNLTVVDAENGLAQMNAILDVESAQLSSNYRSILLGPGWFEAEMWPKASFSGQLNGWDNNGRGAVIGNMTIRDVTQEEQFDILLTCDGVDMCPERAVGFEGELKLSRASYGMTKMRSVVGDDVRISIKGVLTPRAAMQANAAN